MDRRTALSLMSASIASPAFGAEAGGPLLATPEQIAAEEMLLRLIAEPALTPVQAKIRAKLAATARGKTRDGAARLDHAITQWTNSLIFAEMSLHRAEPTILWSTDDTPRTWLGHTINGVGTSGDNPDAIYRVSNIDGDGRYEILGKFDMARRPAQVTMEVNSGSQINMKIDYSKNPDLVQTVSALTDRELTVAPDGAFRITVGGAADGPNHLATVPGPLILGVRDILPDWEHQRPARLTLRRLGGKAGVAVPYADIRAHLLEDLEGFVDFWSAFPGIWFGGLSGNKISEPKGRNGGWGFVNGLSFDLSAPDDALLVTLNPGGAAYTGFQIIDPWMIAPDAKKNQVCLSSAQAVRNADGTQTFVISMTDPGVANWLDTAGLHHGLAIMRWQAVPKDLTAERLVREFRVIKHRDLAKMPELARVTPAQRQATLAARARGYANRTL